MAIDNLFYVLFLFGAGLSQVQAVNWIWQAFKTRIWLRRHLGQETQLMPAYRYGKAGMHLYRLLEGTGANQRFSSVESFLVFCVAIAVGVMLILQMLLAWKIAMVAGIFMGLVPYFFLQMKLHEQRVARSKEGDLLVQELLNQYLIHDCNMLEAIEATAMALQNAPLGRNLYLQLAKALRTAVTEQEVDGILTSFRYAFHTTWGNILASNIGFAHLYGIHVEHAMRDLVKSMTQSRKIAEYGRRENHEARLMLLFLTPVSFLLTIVFACRYFDFTVKTFLANQFGTSLGLQWFLSIMGCYFISLLLHSFLTKEKMDI